MSQCVLLLNSFYSLSSTQAISNPKSERDQDVAWQAVCPSVLLLRKFYEFALELETALCDLLTVLCSPGMAALQHLEQQQVTYERERECVYNIMCVRTLHIKRECVCVFT